ncbi:hypothetical protein JHK82_040282 [Glycine max]|nr:hypothetical protein JHK82_040282 [Glycine max]
MIPQILGIGSAGVDMDFNGEDEDIVEREEDEHVDENGFVVGLHATELKLLPIPRKGEKQHWLEQHEQNHPDQHWCPITHFLSDSEN